MSYSAIIAEIEENLPARVTLTPAGRLLTEQVLGAIINAGAVMNGKFWKGCGDFNQETLIRRAINGLHWVLHHPGCCQIGLIDTTQANLALQHEILVKQVQAVLPANQADQIPVETASNIANAILTSWSLILK